MGHITFYSKVVGAIKKDQYWRDDELMLNLQNVFFTFRIPVEVESPLDKVCQGSENARKLLDEMPVVPNSSKKFINVYSVDGLV